MKPLTRNERIGVITLAVVALIIILTGFLVRRCNGETGQPDYSRLIEITATDKEDTASGDTIYMDSEGNTHYRTSHARRGKKRKKRSAGSKEIRRTRKPKNASKPRKHLSEPVDIATKE